MCPHPQFRDPVVAAMENRFKNTFRWTLVLDDAAKTELKQGAFVNTEKNYILLWSGGTSLASTGFNKTIVMQDNAGLVAVLPFSRGGRRMNKPFRRVRPFLLNRARRQARPDGIGATDIEQPGLGGGLGRRRPGQGRRGGRGRGRGGQGRGRGGQGRGRGGQGRGRGGQGRGKGGQGRGRGGQGRGRGGQGRGQGRGRGFMGGRRGGNEKMPCYIVAAQTSYAETINLLKVNNASGTVDVAKEILDFVTDTTPMVGDLKTTFATEHPNLATFCDERDITDARTVTAGEDLNIENVINVIGVGRRFKIRIKKNLA
ncbi:myosin heavy chain IB-like isoform X2 [Gigantopelta aegis]|uniref:myosin heavy chain IB-like isoform X2 n=1 Tax=Gigantopelta aegis TaxID=1735272 RepID=UPI001B888349|nr:myosin heavy chain IB-like isoform X2 [Gigantopelta aegis]